MEASRYVNLVDYSADREGWRLEEIRITALFRADMATEYGMVGHPKESDVFNVAWSYSHAGGLQNVAYYYEDLARLVKW